MNVKSVSDVIWHWLHHMLPCTIVLIFSFNLFKDFSNIWIHDGELGYGVDLEIDDILDILQLFLDFCPIYVPIVAKEQ